MGRTLITFTQLVRQEIASWNRYRRARQEAARLRNLARRACQRRAV